MLLFVWAGLRVLHVARKRERELESMDCQNVFFSVLRIVAENRCKFRFLANLRNLSLRFLSGLVSEFLCCGC